MKWIKQLFCKHVWRVNGVQLLGQGSDCGRTYNREAVQYQCLKCDKIMIKEQWQDTLFVDKGNYDD